MSKDDLVLGHGVSRPLSTAELQTHAGNPDVYKMKLLEKKIVGTAKDEATIRRDERERIRAGAVERAMAALAGRTMYEVFTVSERKELAERAVRAVLDDAEGGHHA